MYGTGNCVGDNNAYGNHRFVSYSKKNGIKVAKMVFYEKLDFKFLTFSNCFFNFLSATELKFRADYNSTPCGVGVVVVVVVGVRVHFKNGITFERFEISA